MKPVPFTVDIHRDRLDELQRRLLATNWPGDFANENWHYGVEEHWLKDMVDYWAGEFDWRAQEAAMNRMPHFRVEIDGVPIHFIHIPSGRADSIPLLLTHGWPWSFWDWKDIIQQLSVDEPGQLAFDLVVPSLPGVAFSSPLRTPGIGVRQVAGLWVKLMRDALGYERFAAAGGDWGSMITADLGHVYPEHLIGVHMTLPALQDMDPFANRDDEYEEDEQWMIARNRETLPLITSHLTVHTHDPQTLAYALADSPVGTAAWMWERRRAWSDDPGRDFTDVKSRDFLCTLASLYWLTNTSGTALRIYKEHFSAPWTLVNDHRPSIPVPCGYAIGPREMVLLPRKIIAGRTNLQRWTVLPRGGHFSPSEVPDLIAAEYRNFFGSLK